MFNWLLGIAEIFGFSHGELFYLAHKIGRNVQPDVWVNTFSEHADYLSACAADQMSSASSQSLANYYLGATYAHRAALQFTDPFCKDYLPTVEKMEQAFAKAVKQLDAPIETVSIKYQETYLPGYYLHCAALRPTLIMVGGGDTYREDLFYFAGYPAWQKTITYSW